MAEGGAGVLSTEEVMDAQPPPLGFAALAAPPPNPFNPGTIKFWCYAVLAESDATGLRSEEILKRAVDKGYIVTNCRTPQTSIVASMSVDTAQFTRTGPRRYALTFFVSPGYQPPARFTAAAPRAPQPKREREREEEWRGGARPQRGAAARAQAGIAQMAEEDRRPGAPTAAFQRSAAGRPDGALEPRAPPPPRLTEEEAAALAALRRSQPAQARAPFPRLLLPDGAPGRQLLAVSAAPAAWAEAEGSGGRGDYVLRHAGFERHSRAAGGAASPGAPLPPPAFNPHAAPPRHALVWVEGRSGRAWARGGRTEGAMALNGAALPPFARVRLLPGCSLALTAADYWRGEQLPAAQAELVARTEAPAEEEAVAAPAPAGRNGRLPRPEPVPGRGPGRPPAPGRGLFTGMEPAAAPDAARAPVPLQLSPLAPAQWRLADASDSVVAEAMARPIPPGMRVSSWREEKRELGAGRRQFLFWLTDGATGAEVMACVGVESSKYHPKFTISNHGCAFSPRRPRTMITNRRRDVIEFLDACIGSVSEKGAPGEPMEAAAAAAGEVGEEAAEDAAAEDAAAEEEGEEEEEEEEGGERESA